jgi:predicted acyltransferase
MTDDRQPSQIQGRVQSIDALRGFDMFWIIGGGALFTCLHEIFDNPVTAFIATQLEHVKWEGFRFEDLIFPLFLFVVGAVMPFSITRRIEKGQSRRRLYFHIVKRSIVLILLGLMLNGLLRFDWAQMRWCGVLQRIGLCYLLAALLVINTKWRTQAAVAGVVLLLYWAVMALVPVPGYGPGVITPEGDNEGIISTFPAVCTALIGALAGHWLRSKRSGSRKSLGLLLAGLLGLVAGYAWGVYFPIVKNIWTSSFVLVSAGYSLLLLSAFYWLIDVKGYAKWAFFFVVIGANPITIYFVQNFVNFEQIADFFVHGVAEHAGLAAPLILALAVLMVKWLLLWFLYRRRIFLKV